LRKNLTWKEFNALVLATEDEKELASMIKTLKRSTPPSLNRLLRVHQRFNKVRAARERRELLEPLKCAVEVVVSETA
jgi:hypothetical protein